MAWQNGNCHKIDSCPNHACYPRNVPWEERNPRARDEEEVETLFVVYISLSRRCAFTLDIKSEEKVQVKSSLTKVIKYLYIIVF